MPGSGVGGGSPPDVAIVMSAYDGAAHVAEQLESLAAQTVTSWRLFVRDDGSRDETRGAVAAFADRDPRVQLLPDDGRNLGAPASFGVLLDHARSAGAAYVFLADQDDVWRPDKLAVSLEAMRALEAAHGHRTPLLVHTDLEVVGQNLEPIAPSFAAFQRLPEPGAARLPLLLAQNVVTGCTTLLNRALLDVVLPFPTVAMHDWWIAQCAAAFGRIAYLPAPTVRYRQHGGNVVGAKGFAGVLRRALGSPRAWWVREYRNFVLGLAQARALADRLGRAAPTDDAAEVIRAYVEALTRPASRARRVGRVVASGVRPRAPLFQALFLARIAVLGRRDLASTSEAR